MGSNYTPEEVAFLAAIRDDILAQPDFYAPGAGFLADRYGPDRLHQEAVADWQRFKDHPTQKDSHRAVAEDMTKEIADASEREARCAEILDNLSAPPTRERWTPVACASRAIQGMLNLASDTHNDTRAKAVCVLAVLLWDEDADKRHPMFSLFGPWDVTPEGKIESVSRWAATYFLDQDNGEPLRRWMEQVRSTWAALPKAAVVPVERIQQLPIPAEFQPVLMEAVRYVLANPERFADAANRINADLAAKAKPDADGDSTPPVVWLTYMLPDAAREKPSAMTGVDYERWAHRLILLATIASYPGDLSRFGVCGAIRWDLRTVNAPISSSDNTPVALPVLGRTWILCELDGTLRPEMLDKTGESATERATRVVDDKVVDREFKREPWRVRGVLGLLVDRLKPILADLTPIANAPTSTVSPEPVTANADGRAPTPAKPPARHGSELRSWTQSDLDEAIRRYKAERASSYADLCEAIRKNKAVAKKQARKNYGRNAIARALGVKAKAMVSKSPVWLAIAAELGLRLNRDRAQGTRHTQPPGRIGLEIAVEEKSMKPEGGADNAPDEEQLSAERRETIHQINKLATSGRTAEERARNQKAAEDVEQKLQCEEYTDQQACKVIELALNPNV